MPDHTKERATEIVEVGRGVPFHPARGVCVFTQSGQGHPGMRGALHFLSSLVSRATGPGTTVIVSKLAVRVACEQLDI